MKNSLFVLLLVTVVLSFIGCFKKEIDGEVFIVTRGAGNVKLGLVTVYFLTEEQYRLAVNSDSPRYKQFKEYLIQDSIKDMDIYRGNVKYYDDLLLSYERTGYDWYPGLIKNAKEGQDRFYANSNIRYRTKEYADRYFIQHYVDSLGQEVVSYKSNSDGKFKVDLKNNKYWVFANATRLATESEEYHWLFEYTPDEKPLYLSNDNMK